MKIDLNIRRASEVIRTPRVMQLEGLFDVPPTKVSEQAWHHTLDLGDDWNVGVIVGPSGAGKSTLAREAFGQQLVTGWEWPQDKSILDGFPRGLGIKDITGLLSSVGFSSPPSWMRPFRVLSNGEQFRVNMARTLAELPELAVVDEFTSVVDRTVARIGSFAIQKAARKRNQKFVAVTCHYDVLEWLEADWVYEPHTGKLARGRLHRPSLELEVVRTTPQAWRIFEPHHYLSRDIHKGAHCFAALLDGKPAAFCAVGHFPHAIRPAWKEHRTVCLPDYQGIGIGNVLSDYIASLFVATGKPYRDVTSHPAHVHYRSRSKLWKVCRAGTMVSGRQGRTKLREGTGLSRTYSFDRLTWSFEYIGPPRPDEARRFGLPVRVKG